jgi:alpha-tubulin suppressor-like RCC1 family protein
LPDASFPDAATVPDAGIVDSGPPAVAVKIAAGQAHTCALLQDGRIKCWGENVYGEIGNPDASQPLNDSGTSPYVPIPTDVIGLGGVATDMAAGNAYACAVVQGAVLCWGHNSSGELGNGNMIDQSLPTPVLGIVANASAAVTSASSTHTCAVLDGGSVWCWGDNANGQLGGTTVGGNSSVPQPVVGLDSGVAAIALGEEHTCAVSAGGVWCWGQNVYGQLGDGTTIGPRSNPNPVKGLGTPTAICLGQDHSCAIVGGVVECWGSDQYGALGTYDGGSPDAGWVVDDAGLFSTLPVKVTGVGPAARISCGAFTTCAVEVDGGLVCWGLNDWGQLGNGRSGGGLSSLPGPVVAGAPAHLVANGNDHTCAAFYDAGVQCFGLNNWGALGTGNTSNSQVPVEALLGN